MGECSGYDGAVEENAGTSTSQSATHISIQRTPRDDSQHIGEPGLFLCCVMHIAHRGIQRLSLSLLGGGGSTHIRDQSRDFHTAN